MSHAIAALAHTRAAGAGCYCGRDEPQGHRIAALNRASASLASRCGKGGGRGCEEAPGIERVPHGKMAKRGTKAGQHACVDAIYATSEVAVAWAVSPARLMHARTCHARAGIGGGDDNPATSGLLVFFIFLLKFFKFCCIGSDTVARSAFPAANHTHDGGEVGGGCRAQPLPSHCIAAHAHTSS